MPFRVMNIPTERLMNRTLTTKEYWSGIPTLTPALETNTLYTQGFLSEIEDFIVRVENPGQDPDPGNSADNNDLASLFSIYELFHTLVQ